MLVDEDAAVDLAACLGGKLGVRTDADRYDENVEINGAAALEVRLVRLELRYRVAEQEFYALALAGTSVRTFGRMRGARSMTVSSETR